MFKKIRTSYQLLSTLCVFFVGLSSQQALAHANLKAEFPGADTVISQSPDVLQLGFSEGIELNFSGVKILGPDQVEIKTGKLKVDPNNETQVLLPIEQSLHAGTYNVSWHVVSVDGHKSKGQYSFTVK